MRDWCSECQFETYDGAEEPCINCVKTYNEKPSEFTPATDEVRGVGKWEMHSDRPDTLICSICYAGFDVWKWDQRRMHYCPRCGARMKGAEDGATDTEKY